MNFLDIRNHGFFKVAAIIPKVELACPEHNLIEHLDQLNQVAEQGTMYTLCPELGLTGYSCGDLFHSQELLQSAETALEQLLTVSVKWDMIISVGLPLLVEGAIYNVAVTFYNNQILGVVPKSYPPEYREFYELRHFARASETQVDTINLLGQDVPFGNDIIITHPKYKEFCLHTEICEDGWVPIPPSTQAALAGATVLANLSASNITIGKADYRRQLMIGSSGRNIAAQIYCAAGFGESTSDLSWDGDAIIAERGTLLKTSKRFQLNGTHVITDIDLSSIIADRIRQGSFRQNGSDNKKIYRRITIPTSKLITNSSVVPEVYYKLLRHIEPKPFVPSDPAKRNERCEETFMIQATALANRLKSLPEEMRKVVIGISGGQDSTHALNIAVYTMDLIGLPRTNVTGITMPGFGTTSRTKNNAIELCTALGVTLKEIPISQIASEVFNAVGHDINEINLVFENTQAWSRKLIELATACKFGGIVLGTGDLSELMLGWCTMFGDHASHYGINAGVPKTLISFLIKWTAEVVFEKEPVVQKILLDILATPVSPELLPATGDKITQITEDNIGPYELHDFFGYYFLRFGYQPTKIARLAVAAFIHQDRDGKKYSLKDIKYWLEVFLKRFFANQYKRNCLPDGPKVGLICISPRGDWRMPADAESTTWINNWLKIPEDI